MAYVLIIAGLISIVSGIFMLIQKEEPVALTVTPQPSEAIARAKNDFQEKVSNVTKSAGLTESEKKGKEFEDFIARKFKNNKFFTVVDWRGDKNIDGVYPESNRYPDLEIRFNLGNQQDAFAVECKWRKGSYKGKLQWGEDYQLDQYQKFSIEKNLPVFIVIGVGGSPGAPKYLYIIPLGEVNSNILDDADIKQYLKTDERDFYWNLEEKTLS